ncbi:uncharacterized mitochondrial protein AtMg00810-like [Vicia villosa]|uniref:uncharacterized mitochondrial protein AtMg00810-like n=1 Tax=Vicia villosa TaxID=3911 RepID=UPI00273CD2CC|nr:uncharacterized mitochondrial protein AtMg00810-like [Vicia villosa]
MKLGFIHSRCDHSLFVYSKQGTTLYDLVYVDDILITGSSANLVHDLINKLHKAFALKKLGTPEYFLGIEFVPQKNGPLLLTQIKYIKDLLDRAKMPQDNGVPTLMLSTCKLSKHGSQAVSNPHLYRSIVGALQYVTLTRPDISYSVNKACQFMLSPCDTHWAAVRRIIFSPSATTQKFSFRAYSDSDWASDPYDRRSTSSSCIFLGPNLIAWSSKKQSLVTRSSTEAKYRTLAHTTADLDRVSAN